MQALKQEVYIPKDHQLQLKIPDDIPIGKAEVFLIFQVLEQVNSTKKRIFGNAKGKIKIADNFDAPLPDEILNGFYS